MSTHPNLSNDYEVLGLRPDANVDPQTLRAAYLEQVQRCPPESDPQRFEKIRDAYQRLSDPYRSVPASLRRFEIDRPLIDQLAEHRQGKRSYVGSETLLRAMERMLPHQPSEITTE
jgi:hypothetical protein